MSEKREPRYPGEFLLTPPPGQQCFERPLLSVGHAVVAGELVSKVGADYVPFDPAGEDGSEQPVGIAFASCDATDEARAVVLLARGAAVNAKCFAWPDAITEEQQSAALGWLAANTGLAARGMAITAPVLNESVLLLHVGGSLLLHGGGSLRLHS